jgi:hypothetical protein
MTCKVLKVVTDDSAVVPVLFRIMILKKYETEYRNDASRSLMLHIYMFAVIYYSDFVDHMS